MSKDIMYPSLKEMHDKYPPWLEKNKGNLSEKELDNYKSQLDCIKRGITIYEDSSIDGSTQVQMVMDILNRMNVYGDPPPEIMNQLAPGMMGGPGGGPQCPQQ